MSRRMRGPSAARRRARAFGLIVAMSVLLIGAATVALRPREYESGAALVFLPSPSVEEFELQVGQKIPPESQSPLARDGTTVVGDVFVRIYRGSAKRRELAERGLVGRLTVTTFRSMNGQVPVRGPLLTIEVVAPSPLLASQDAQLIVDDVGKELDARQQGFDPRLSVKLAVTTPPTTPVVISGSRVRAVGAFLVIGLLAGLCVTALATWADRRRRPAPRLRSANRSAGGASYERADVRQRNEFAGGDGHEQIAPKLSPRLSHPTQR